MIVSGLNSVAHPAPSESHKTASSTTAVILAAFSRPVFSSRPDERDSVGRIIKVERYFESGLSARPWKGSSPSSFEIWATTYFSAASNNRGAIGICPMGGCGTRRGLNSTAVAEYTFQATQHRNVFVAFASIDFHYQKTFCKDEKLKRKLRKKGQNWIDGNLALRRRSPGKALGRETTFVGRCAGGRKRSNKYQAEQKKRDRFILENTWRMIVDSDLKG